jgi:hypothetical protein
MTTPETKPPWSLEDLLWLSAILFHTPYIIDQTIRWTDHAWGFFNGIVHLAIFFPPWLVLIAPWTAIVHAVYRWRQWRRFLAPLALAPAAAPLLVISLGLLSTPPTPATRFQIFTGIQLPANTTRLQTHFTGGGIADKGDTYYFETTPIEVMRLIEALQLAPVENDLAALQSLLRPLPGGPDFQTWEGGHTYERLDEHKRRAYALHTDTSQTRVYLYTSEY